MIRKLLPRKIPLISVDRLLSILRASSITLYYRSIDPLFEKNVTNFSKTEPYNISSLGMYALAFLTGNLVLQPPPSKL